MSVRTTSPVVSLDTLVRMKRRRRVSAAPEPVRLSMPDGMTAPLGCDAVVVPAVVGRLLLARLPRVGCVYEDGTHWWWIVPSDSDVALEWPAPAEYATGAVYTGGTVAPGGQPAPALIHQPDGTIPYTPPIPLYLALCRVTGTTPSWSRPISA
ncbi:hypothetical protein [Streptomyces cavernae]|uniref:hypothetical protein n=1 Tax=Streptomyces cavernae TaxID=2259034 RepID=UPI000FEBE807|nr:hypothetical protein [Streptomyces cavernae]